MRGFLIRLGLFAAPLVAVHLGFYYGNLEYLAAHRTTASYSMNEKIAWLPPPETVEIIALGSSMTLNNLASEQVVRGLGSASYLNLGSWGLTMADIADLAPVIVRLYHPGIVICASNVTEFQHSTLNVDPHAVEAELVTRTGASWLNRIGRYYVLATLDNRRSFRTNRIYDSLQFDRFGGVPFATSGFLVEDRRWNRKLNVSAIDDSSYVALRSLSEHFTQHGVTLLFVQTPARRSARDHDYEGLMAKHRARIQQILSTSDSGHVFVDLSDVSVPDALFVDHLHLNAAGAAEVTRMACKKFLQELAHWPSR